MEHTLYPGLQSLQDVIQSVFLRHIFDLQHEPQKCLYIVLNSARVHQRHQLVPCEPRLIPWSELCPQLFLHLRRSSITSILDGDGSATFEKKWKSEAANGIEFRNNKREKQKMKQVVELNFQLCNSLLNFLLQTVVIQSMCRLHFSLTTLPHVFLALCFLAPGMLRSMNEIGSKWFLTIGTTIGSSPRKITILSAQIMGIALATLINPVQGIHYTMNKS
jgi:hypothetical protein